MWEESPQLLMVCVGQAVHLEKEMASGLQEELMVQKDLWILVVMFHYQVLAEEEVMLCL
jgi:hypothetical protein